MRRIAIRQRWPLGSGGPLHRRGVAQPGRVLRSGRRSRRFESSHPDHFFPQSAARPAGARRREIPLPGAVPLARCFPSSAFLFRSPDRRHWRTAVVSATSLAQSPAGGPAGAALVPVHSRESDLKEQPTGLSRQRVRRPARIGRFAFRAPIPRSPEGATAATPGRGSTCPTWPYGVARCPLRIPRGARLYDIGHVVRSTALSPLLTAMPWFMRDGLIHFHRHCTTGLLYKHSVHGHYFPASWALTRTVVQTAGRASD